MLLQAVCKKITKRLAYIGKMSNFAAYKPKR